MMVIALALIGWTLVHVGQHAIALCVFCVGIVAMVTER